MTAPDLRYARAHLSGLYAYEVPFTLPLRSGFYFGTVTVYVDAAGRLNRVGNVFQLTREQRPGRLATLTTARVVDEDIDVELAARGKDAPTEDAMERLPRAAFAKLVRDVERRAAAAAFGVARAAGVFGRPPVLDPSAAAES